MEDLDPAVEHIRRWRTAKGISQQEMAEAMGLVNRTTYANLEYGKSRLTNDAGRMAAKFMGIPHDLLGSQELIKNPFAVAESKPTYGDDVPKIVTRLEAENLSLYRRLSECQERLLQYLNH